MGSAVRTDRPVQAQRRGGWGARILRWLMIVVGLVALAIFGYWAYLFTLTPVPDPHGWAVGNTKPGETLKFYLNEQSPRAALKAIGGNIVLLAPLGVLLPLVSNRLRGFFRITFLVALLSSGIELIQGHLISGRTFDVDDIILNTAGAALAYLFIGRRFGRLMHGRRR